MWAVIDKVWNDIIMKMHLYLNDLSKLGCDSPFFVWSEITILSQLILVQIIIYSYRINCVSHILTHTHTRNSIEYSYIPKSLFDMTLWHYDNAHKSACPSFKRLFVCVHFFCLYPHICSLVCLTLQMEWQERKNVQFVTFFLGL